MKLQTSILPRRDGTVSVVGEDGQKYTFQADADGYLSCDIEHEPTVAKLLAAGDFEPVNAEDFDAAIALAQTAAPADNQGDDEGDDDFEEEIVNGGMPVEAQTPPATIHKPGIKPVGKKKK